VYRPFKNTIDIITFIVCMFGQLVSVQQKHRPCTPSPVQETYEISKSLVLVP